MPTVSRPSPVESSLGRGRYAAASSSNDPARRAGLDASVVELHFNTDALTALELQVVYLVRFDVLPNDLGRFDLEIWHVVDISRAICFEDLLLSFCFLFSVRKAGGLCRARL